MGWPLPRHYSGNRRHATKQALLWYDGGMRKIILASQSPRRRELLTNMGVNFDVVPSNFDEKLDDSRHPEEVAIELAMGKASLVAQQYPDCIVIGSDTIVTIDGRQLEKPHDETEAYQMLEALAGTYNDITTSLVVMCKDADKLFSAADTARAFFKPYDEAAVRTYVESGDPMDKAGGFGVQSGAAPLIDYVQGHADTIIGLPTHLLVGFLDEFGVASHVVEPILPVRQVP